MSASAPLSISQLPTTDSSSGRFHAALSPWLFRDAAGALEPCLDSETTLTVPTKAPRQWLCALDVMANGVRLQDDQEPASKQVLVAIGAGQETEKGPQT